MGQRIKRTDWPQKIEQWLKSGKSARAWCRENNVVYTTFLGWHYRLKGNPVPSPLPDKTSEINKFIELKEVRPVCSGIFLECENIRIHLSADFDPLTLRKCLSFLRGKPC